jgi:hypothetical protein
LVEEQRSGSLARLWQLEHVTGKYIISEKSMTEEQWIKERATLFDGEATDVTPVPVLEDKS